MNSEYMLKVLFNVKILPNEAEEPGAGAGARPFFGSRSRSRSQPWEPAPGAGSHCFWSQLQIYNIIYIYAQMNSQRFLQIVEKLGKQKINTYKNQLM